MNDVLIGKHGLTPGVVAQVVADLKRLETITVKFLPAALPAGAKSADRKKLAQELAEKTNATVVKRVGGVVTLRRSKRL
ncbi:MAG: YhbY family RNA-binding protein [Candidatus Woesearchaeota archaeon]|nr:YhbY family RNA-binding protein [Candidatus Woesearchaeota archaeon]